MFKDNLNIYIYTNSGLAPFRVMAGGATHFIECAKRWKKCGNNVNVITTEVGYEMCKTNELEGDYFLISSKSSDEKGIILTYLIRTIKCIISDIKFNGNNIVLYSSSDFMPDIIPAMFMKLKNKKFKWVIALHLIAENPLKRSNNNDNIFQFINNSLFFIWQNITLWMAKYFADIVFVVNKEMVECLVHKKIPSHKIKLMSNGVDLKRISKIKKQECIFDGCFLGRYHPQKGLFDLIRIWNYVCVIKKDAKLAIVGGGSEKWKHKLDYEIKTMGLENNIKIFGFVDTEEKYTIIKSSKLFLFPSVYESWGIVACEAMACGIPVIAYNLSIFKELFPMGMKTVPLNDIEAFSQVIIELLEDESEYNRLRNNALDMASKYDWSIASEKILDDLKLLFV